MTTPTGRCQQCCSPRCAGPGLIYNPDTGQYEVNPVPDGGIIVTPDGVAADPAGGGGCACVVQPGVHTTVTGDGEPATPYVVDVNPPTLISATAPGNILTVGPDNLLAVDCGAVGACVPPTAVVAGPGVTVTGAGTPAAPYEVSALSSDPGNLLTVGPDGRLLLDCTAVNTCGGGGGSFACADLNTCSIDALADVDTTTAAPGAGDLLVFDGAAWVPAEPGCGLDSSAGTLGLNTSAWPYACPQTDGGGVYCDPATGRVHTDPPPRTVTGESPLGSTLFINRAAFCAAVTTANTHHPLTADQPNRITINNPDPCRPMLLDIEQTGRIRLDYDDDEASPADWLNIVGYDLLVNGVPIGLTQEYGAGENPGGAQTVTHMRLEPAPVVTIPPGGSVQIGTRIYGLKTNDECRLFLAAVNPPRIRVIGNTVVA